MVKLNFMSNIKQPTKEQVLKAAQQCPSSKQVLKELWPDAFEDNTPYIKVGQLFLRKQYRHAYAVIHDEHTRSFRVLNITHSRFWGEDKMLYTNSLKDIEHKYLTVSEFTRLTGYNDLSQFIRLSRVGDTFYELNGIEDGNISTKKV